MDPKMSPTVSPKARVIKILNRIGARGIFTEVRVQLVDQPKMQFMRTVKGPVHLGDIVDFEDTEMTWQSSQKSKSNFGDIC